MNSTPLKICLPIIRETVQAVISSISEAPQDYSMIEVWLDYIADLNEENLKQILTAIEPRTALLVFRRQNLESIKMSFTQRCAYLQSIPKSTWVDFDIRQQKDEISWCRTHRAELPLILSFHNYELTPSQEELHTLANEMLAAGTTISKFSTFCRDESEALRLMSLLVDIKRKNRRATVLGMGKAGVLTRVVGPLLGSEIAYAPLTVANSSAPGQLTLQQLTTILRELQ